MTELLIALGVFGLYATTITVALCFTVLKFIESKAASEERLLLVLERARLERSELEDRLMTLTNPMAATHAASIREPEPVGAVSFVDEDREAELDLETDPEELIKSGSEET